MDLSIVVAILIVIILFLIRNIVNQGYQPRQKIKIAKAADLEFLDSGDIILFRHKQSNPIPKLLFGDEFSHSGLVWRAPDGKLYVYEAISDGDLSNIGDDTSGVKITPIYTRLSTYEGYKCIKKLSPRMTPLQREKFNSFIKRSETMKFKDPGLVEAAKCVLNIKTPTDSDTTYCSLLTTQALIEVGIINLESAETCMRPQCMAKLFNHGRYAPGVSYSPLIELQFV